MRGEQEERKQKNSGEGPLNNTYVSTNTSYYTDIYYDTNR